MMISASCRMLIMLLIPRAQSAQPCLRLARHQRRRVWRRLKLRTAVAMQFCSSSSRRRAAYFDMYVSAAWRVLASVCCMAPDVYIGLCTLLTGRAHARLSKLVIFDVLRCAISSIWHLGKQCVGRSSIRSPISFFVF